MRHRTAFAAPVAVSLAVSLTVSLSVSLGVLASPVGAKGIESATITGPALDHPIDVMSDASGKLPTLTGVWETRLGHPEPVPLLDRTPTAQLGPRYTVTWRITGPGGPTPLRQDVYPDAEGGPLVHTASGQRFFDGVTQGGWYQAPVALRDVLSRLGVPPVGVVTPSDAADTGAVSPAIAGPGIPLDAPTTVPTRADDPWWPEVVAGLAVTAVVVGPAITAARLRRARRRGRVAAVQL
jgi:hypothetical protein